MVNSLVVKNESELEKSLTTNQKELIIQIESELLLSNNWYIRNDFERLIIKGSGKDKSSLKFKDETHRICFGKEIIWVELQNISVIGNLYFDHNVRVELKEVSVTGSIDSSFDGETLNDYIIFNNVLYRSSPYALLTCINLGGNVQIENSKFWGGSLCQKRLMHFNGEDKYSFSIKDSYLSGEYGCPCLEIEHSPNIEILNSVMEKGQCGLNISG